VIASTPKCFDVLGMFCSILIVVDLKHWKTLSDDVIQYGHNLKIFSDSPEREVKLIQVLKKGEREREREREREKRQYLLQVVTEHWIKCPYAQMSLPIEESLKKTVYNYNFLIDIENCLQLQFFD
jgi:hypothetical protein